MEGAAHDYNVASHNALTGGKLCPGGCLSSRQTEKSPIFQPQLSIFNLDVLVSLSLFLKCVFLSKIITLTALVAHKEA